jgi:NifB/MoaA-like Fe-S oxidoreductase
LKIVDELNEEFGVNFVLPADEYFVKAGLPVKETAFYGDFEQIENGVGLTRKFLSEVDQALEKENYALKTPKTSLLVCGVSAAKTLAPIVEQCEKAITGLQIKLLPVVNTFFGETVTCTGLLTGQDILSAVQQYTKNGNTYDEILLAGNTMKEFEDVFLCGMTLDEMKKKLATNAIRVNRDGGFGLVEILCKENT